ncbi:LAME_0H05842g1_1 [Lachancea meyersii CBS 8951]|uniref:LAME_0H05842g1_1 n=1 Tax=Lachancea meyersii CBS 8951 TaxID=1266667 RepID=A0A1G4KER7_9SACH|nr:LAME_0H05842g1_1 [Lachancea meyersii CBS 8951]
MYHEESRKLEEPHTKSRAKPRSHRKVVGRRAGKRAAQRMNMALGDDDDDDDENEDENETAHNSDFVTCSSPFKDQKQTSNSEPLDSDQDLGHAQAQLEKRKIKIAPRSTLQFKVGPDFKEGATYCQVVCSTTKLPVHFVLTPRIDRGFDNIDNQWIGYKRNYFTLVTSFEVVGVQTGDFLLKSYQVTGLLGSKPVEVKYFAVRLVAICTEDESPVTLVQHTAKRDKGPQFEPPILPLVPAPLPTHQIIREASNVRNEAKMRKYDHLFYLNRFSDFPYTPEDDLVSSYPENRIRKVARYERVQFSSSINAKKNATQTKHFQLKVILGCVINETRLHPDFFRNLEGRACFVENRSSTFVPITEMITPPLVIRGRSPSNYYGTNAANLDDKKGEQTTRTRSPEYCDQKPDMWHETSAKALNSTFKVCGYQYGSQEHEFAPSDITNKRGLANTSLPHLTPRLSLSSLARPDVRVDLQTMSCIEALMLKKPAGCTDNGALRKDLDRYPKLQQQPIVGMKDIELAPLLRLASSHCDRNLGFTHESFNLGMGSFISGFPPIQHDSTSKQSAEKKRKLNKKTPLSKSSPPDEQIAAGPEDVTETSLVEHHSPNDKDGAMRQARGFLSLSRAGGRANPMDISFCLNLSTDPNVKTLARPSTSRRGLVSRQLLTSNAKPSDIFGSNEFFDEPSFYRH